MLQDDTLYDDELIRRLADAAAGLRRVSRMVTKATVLTLYLLASGFLLEVIYGYLLSQPNSSYWDSASGFALMRIFVGIFATLSTFLAFSGSLHFDTLRRSGDALFQEVSNHLQGMPSDFLSSAIGLEFRIALRELAAACELPLFPGRWGAGIYMLLNSTVLVAIMLLFVS